jgi:hypothetical protein
VSPLRPLEIKLVVDVSNLTNPQFNGFTYSNIESTTNTSPLLELAEARIDRSLNAFCENQSFHNYADYAQRMSSERDARPRDLGLATK